ncbi:MAG: hypothetical protein R3E32_28195 [Chitinophagales bacterium]
MKLIKTLAFFTSYLFMVLNAVAQENYVEASITTLQGENLNGWIDYRDWQQSPSKIDFKETLEGNEKEYYPVDILEFSVGEAIYKSAVIEIEQSSRKIENLDANKDLKLSKDTVFLETLIEGEVELYAYDGKNSGINFYIKEDESYTLLQYKKYMDDNASKVKEFKGYIYQLLQYMEKCSEMQTNLTKTVYTKVSLKKAFKNYYRCIDALPDFERKGNKIALKLGVVGGINYTSMSLISNSQKHIVFDDIKLSNSVDATYGVNLEAFLPINQGKWSIYSDLILTNYSMNGSFEKFSQNVFHEVHELNIALRHLKLSHLLRYQFAKTPLVIGLGISHASVVSEVENYYSYKDVIFDPPVVFEEREFVTNPNVREFGLLLSVEVRLWRLGLEARYEKSDGIPDLISITTPTNRLYLLAKFRLN